MPKPIDVLVAPPDTELPLRVSPFRFAACAPGGGVTNSWRLWKQLDREGREHVYVACRDNFRELKVSLHASGIWRLAYTEEALRKRPDLVPEGEDRVWSKWRQPEDAASRPVIAFQVAFPPGAVYLRQAARKIRLPEVLIEFPPDSSKMIVASVCVCPTAEPITTDNDIDGGVLGLLDLKDGRSIQLAATYEDSKWLADAMQEQFQERLSTKPVPPLPTGLGVFFVHGLRGDIPYVAAAHFSVSATRDERHTIPFVPGTESTAG